MTTHQNLNSLWEISQTIENGIVDKKWFPQWINICNTIFECPIWFENVKAHQNLKFLFIFLQNMKYGYLRRIYPLQNPNNHKPIGSILTMLMHHILVGNQQILNDDILQHKQIAKNYQWTFLKYTPWVSQNHQNTNTYTHNHANHYEIYLNPFFVSFLYFIHWCFQFSNIWHIM
jgi:hypothetical protein